MFYFVRVNGETLHNNPHDATHYVPGEPPSFPQKRFNALNFCPTHGIIRIGWPDTGDLNEPSKTGALAQGYSLNALKPYIQKYLRTFRDIAVGSVILMPDTDTPGDFYMGEVIEPYHYTHNIPSEPYEHSHRLGVRWDKRADGRYRVYRAARLGIETQGGFWRRVFWALDETEKSSEVIPTLMAARENK